ncbi:hypothetical protein [Burkholderia ubonensis]|uniref:hypothetical protein n=1 Tax=Burkholderia ubonensis TaxID=101571 RepID=UPI00075A5E0B|nr:hypothetical protein [Burkholderia ubonensis]
MTAALLVAVALPAVAAPAGVTFGCAPQAQAAFERAAHAYLGELGIQDRWVTTSRGPQGVTLTLSGPYAQMSPLDFYQQPELDLRDEMLPLPKGAHGELMAVQTVSRKEIALALMHPGRSTAAPCDLQEFKDHIGIRQNIAAWAERLYWNWPDGGPAQWNPAFWRRGTPTHSTLAAFYNAFQEQDKYGIGCYTATKLVIGQGVLDYYARVKPDPARLTQVLSRLEADKDPLVDVEPPAMWQFETDYDAAEHNKPGKLLRLEHGVQPLNFIPGDWAYLLNTDPTTYQHTGYEGSNAIYLGRGRFDDYYNDHSNAYSYRQKLNEVYQWRNGVFSRTRDGHKVVPLSEKDILSLSTPPEAGGLVISWRAVPYFFKYTDN